MALVIPIKQERECDGCTKCCDGWLSGVAHGHEFYIGKSCYWKGKNGCNIYSVRPYEPCVTFKCFWKYSKLVPKHFKPNLIGVIIVERFDNGFKFVDVNIGGKLVSEEVISWCNQMYTENLIENIRYYHNQKYTLLSKDDTFIKYMHSKLGVEKFNNAGMVFNG